MARESFIEAYLIILKPHGIGTIQKYKTIAYICLHYNNIEAWFQISMSVRILDQKIHCDNPIALLSVFREFS